MKIVLELFCIGLVLVSCNGFIENNNSTTVQNVHDSITNSNVALLQNDMPFYEELYDSIEENTNSYPTLDSQAIGINFIKRGNYSALKNKIWAQQQKAHDIYIHISDSIEKQRYIDSVGNYLTDVLLNAIFPHWYGTQWEFSGTTEIPGMGYVACGYFVSTTLRDVGFNLNRYKFAQQTGLVGAKTLQMGEKIRKYYSQDGVNIPEKLVNELKSGLYQVGLSFHVGYLLIRNHRAYFIHSNYIHTGVMCENAANSDAFASTIYVISDITFNRKLIEKWILGSKIEIER